MIHSKISYFITRKITPGYKIKKRDLVIDIGSGDKPFWRANVFLDNLSLGNLHRHSNTETVISFGNLVNSDITKTKFKDKAFDFSFCSHLLEHVERPDLVIKEIIRISKKGYIEVPNGVIEFIHPFHSHLWFILLSGKKLIFVRKGKKLHESLLSNSLKYSSLIEKTRDPFIRLYWKNKIEYEIIDLNKESDKYFPPKKTPKTGKNPTTLKMGNLIYFNTINLLRKINGLNNKINVNDLYKNTKI